MRSKTSWFNKEIIYQSTRSAGWIGIIYLLGLLFALPLKVLMIASRENYYYQNINNLFSYEFEIQIFFLISIPVLLAIFLFRFLHAKQLADLIHSMPIKRENIYKHYLFIGVFFLIIPVLITGLVLITQQLAMDLDSLYSVNDVLYWIAATIVITLFIYVSSVLIGMFTGISVMQGVLAYIFLFLPSGISVLIFFNLKFFLNGFAYDYYLNKNMEKLSPIIQIIELNNHEIKLTGFIIYLLLSTLFYFLAMQVYKKRKVETTSQAIVFSQIRPIFKYGVTFCTMLFGGLYFGETQDSLNWTIFGYVTGSILGYIVAEMVLQKTWRVFQNVKGYLVYAGVIIILVLALKFDITGFEKKLSTLSDVEQVYFSENVYSYIHEEMRHKEYYTNPDTIKKIQQFHKQLVEDGQGIVSYNPDSETQNLLFIYELKNGEKMIRQYRIEREKYKEFLKPIYETDEYKKANYTVYNLEGNVDRITISPRGPVAKRTVIAEPAKINDAIRILQEEVGEQTYEEMVDTREPWSEIEFLLENDERIHFEWRKSYTDFEEWLTSIGEINNARITADDFSYAVVMKQEITKDNPHFSISHDELYKKFKSDTGTLKITAKDQLEACIRNMSWKFEGEYMIAFYYNNQDFPDIRSFDENHIPTFILDHFE